jgi:hypothetical protein
VSPNPPPDVSRGTPRVPLLCTSVNVIADIFTPNHKCQRRQPRLNPRGFKHADRVC